MLTIVLVAGVAVALYLRRWRLAVVMVASPLVGIVLARLLKQMFGRENDGALAYPSGHTTVAVIVMGMIVLAAGAAMWAMVVAAVFCLLAVLGQGVTYHYFTDTVGGCCWAARWCASRRWPPNLTRVNPAATQITALVKLGHDRDARS